MIRVLKRLVFVILFLPMTVVSGLWDIILFIAIGYHELNTVIDWFTDRLASFDENNNSKR